MALRSLTRGLFQLVRHRAFIAPIQQQMFVPKPIFRTFAAVQPTNGNAYKDLTQFLEKEIQLEKSAQQHPSALPKIEGFEAQTKGPEVTLTRRKGNEQITVTFNVANSVNTSDSDQDADFEGAGQQKQEGKEGSEASGQLKSRPTFTVDINRGGQTLSFSCSYLPDDFSGMGQSPNEQGGQEAQQTSEDFQIDEFAIHDGEWNEKVYSADCAVIDGELYDKLLNILEENGIGEGEFILVCVIFITMFSFLDFANQLANFSTAYEHRQYIDLLEKLQKFARK